jgi:tryptophan 2,3-dioxygenase
MRLNSTPTPARREGVWTPVIASRVMPLTYGRYLQLEELLSLQRPLSDGPEHDELLFIVIHQVYELWFKQVLHELARLQTALATHDAPSALATFKRILTILKLLVAKVDILETMTPVSFLSFRSRLEAASGFESWQFREVEFVLGHRREGTAHHHAGTAAGERLAARLREPSLYDSFLGFLVGHGYPIPAEIRSRDFSQPVPEDPRIRTVLVEIYRHDPATRDVCERMVDLDEGIQEWRYRHVKMVERTIGSKVGTGGSPGAEYLRRTLFQPLFPDLWSIRASL